MRAEGAILAGPAPVAVVEPSRPDLPARARSGLRALRADAARWDVFEALGPASILMLILFAGGFWYLTVPLTILGTVALLHPPLRRSADFWLAAAAIVAIGNLRNWHLADNHKYLMAYWCLALAWAYRSPRPAENLRANGRLLIGLAFLFATLWKALSPDYATGAFFHHTLLTDPRFTVVGQVAGGLPPEAAARNRQALEDLRAFDGAASTARLESTPRLEATALAMTVWTIGLEGWIALAFLWPGERGPARWRNALLIGFLFTTYLVAPVIGFGWVLAISGAAQTTRRHPLARVGYVAAFLVLQLYRVPWQGLVLKQ
jgi:hypothetical protein